MRVGVTACAGDTLVQGHTYVLILKRVSLDLENEIENRFENKLASEE